MREQTEDPSSVLPVDVQLEREILGCCFSENTALLSDVRAVLDVSDFAIEDHRRVFRSLCRLADTGEPLTWTRVYADMKARLEPISLSALNEFVGPEWALDRLLRRAKDLARRRDLIFRCRDIAHQAADLTLSLDELGQRLVAAWQSGEGSGLDTGADDIGGIVQRAGGVDSFLAPRKGIPTPWEEFDHCTGGWQKGDLILIAGRPSMGKTAFVLNALYDSALRGIPSVFYTYEMSAESIVVRLISRISKITYRDIQNGDLAAEERRAVAAALDTLVALPITIVGAAGKSALAIRCHAERLKRKGKLAIAAIDYIGLIPGPDRQNRNQELGDICRQLKEMAGALEVPLLVLSQLNRATETRPDKRPNMGDLRDSGELENHADLIGFLFRPGYYNRNEAALRLVAELSIAKQRNGDTPTIPLIFRGEYGIFETDAEARHSND